MTGSTLSVTGIAPGIRVIVAVLLAAFLAGCSGPPKLSVDKGGRGIAVIPLKSYGVVQADLLMWFAGVTGIRAHNAVDCYRILYPSRDSNGNPITLSGLLALPHNAKPRGLISYQHGTTSDRRAVPSNLSTEGLAAAVLSSGSGFATVAPDYAGLGISKPPHPYYVAADTARAVIDLIHAVRHVNGVPDNPPLLLGFSEGGYASLAAQRTMEAHGENVLATASIAGAFNLHSISVPWTLTGRSPQAPIYLALWIRGYSQHYGHPLQTVFTPRYAKLVPELLDTSRDPDAVVKALPRDPRALFDPPVLGALAGHGQHWLIAALDENDMGRWRARAPIRLYYGTKDIDVPPTEATTTARQMKALGSNVTAIDIGNEDHNQSVLAAAPLIMRWFATLARPPGDR